MALLSLLTKSFLEIPLSVVTINIILLIGVDILRIHKILIDYKGKSHKCRSSDWKLPLSFNNHHSYIVLSIKSVQNTRKELKKIHKQFAHTCPKGCYKY